MRAKFIGHEDAITSMSILYNESYFISSSIDLSIRLWDIKLNICLHVYKAHLSTIWDIKFARQGNFISFFFWFYDYLFILFLCRLFIWFMFS